MGGGSATRLISRRRVATAGRFLLEPSLFMGLRDLFGRKEKDTELDPIADLVLGKLKVGYLVDYDLKTWEVTGYCRYTFDGNTVEEWEITAGGREKRYLELADEHWSLAQKVVIGAIEGDIRRHILREEDPPSRIVYKGKHYYLDNSCAGYMFPNGEGDGEEVIRWEFLDEDEKSFLGIERWSETELGSAAGFFVQDYEFTNILPGSGTE